MRLSTRVLALLTLASLLLTLPPSTSAQSGLFLPGFPRLRQQHSLTCESSAASMGTREAVTEGQIMAAMPRNRNPNLGFRGNPNGVQGTSLVDYGVYNQPVHNALLRYGFRSDVIMYGTDQQIVSYLQRGWPVVTWVTYALQKAQPRFAWANGTQFFLVPHEHAVLVVGASSRWVYANDPWTGQLVKYDWGNFDRAWGYFANMALAIEPCAAPAPVTGLRAQEVSADRIVWVWDPAANAVSYQITVIRHGKKDRVVYQGTRPQPRFTYDAPDPGVSYEIDVTSVSACGGTSDTSARRADAVPAATPQPTPNGPPTTPLPEQTPVPTPITGGARPSPTVTATP